MAFFQRFADVSQIIHNRVLICAGVSWFSAQFIKIFISFLRERRFNFRIIMSSGGMPSSHSATAVALAVAVGRQCGFASGIFAVAAILAFIVVYDAVGVRAAAGRQAHVLNQIMDEVYDGQPVRQKRLKELIGHTPFQTLMGVLLGILIGFLFPLEG